MADQKVQPDCPKCEELKAQENCPKCQERKTKNEELIVQIQEKMKTGQSSFSLFDVQCITLGVIGCCLASLAYDFAKAYLESKKK